VTISAPHSRLGVVGRERVLDDTIETIRIFAVESVAADLDDCDPGAGNASVPAVA
jgi:hypothetical protein